MRKYQNRRKYSIKIYIPRWKRFRYFIYYQRRKYKYKYIKNRKVRTQKFRSLRIRYLFYYFNRFASLRLYARILIRYLLYYLKHKKFWNLHNRQYYLYHKKIQQIKKYCTFGCRFAKKRRRWQFKIKRKIFGQWVFYNQVPWMLNTRWGWQVKWYIEDLDIDDFKTIKFKPWPQLQRSIPNLKNKLALCRFSFKSMDNLRQSRVKLIRFLKHKSPKRSVRFCKKYMRYILLLRFIQRHIYRKKYRFISRRKKFSTAFGRKLLDRFRNSYNQKLTLYYGSEVKRNKPRKQTLAFQFLCSTILFICYSLWMRKNRKRFNRYEFVRNQFVLRLTKHNRFKKKKLYHGFVKLSNRRRKFNRRKKFRLKRKIKNMRKLRFRRKNIHGHFIRNTYQFRSILLRGFFTPELLFYRQYLWSTARNFWYHTLNWFYSNLFNKYIFYKHSNYNAFSPYKFIRFKATKDQAKFLYLYLLLNTKNNSYRIKLLNNWIAKHHVYKLYSMRTLSLFKFNWFLLFLNYSPVKFPSSKTKNWFEPEIWRHICKLRKVRWKLKRAKKNKKIRRLRRKIILQRRLKKGIAIKKFNKFKHQNYLNTAQDLFQLNWMLKWRQLKFFLFNKYVNSKLTHSRNFNKPLKYRKFFFYCNRWYWYYSKRQISFKRNCRYHRHKLFVRQKRFYHIKLGRRFFYRWKKKLHVVRHKVRYGRFKQYRINYLGYKKYLHFSKYYWRKVSVKLLNYRARRRFFNPFTASTNRVRCYLRIPMLLSAQVPYRPYGMIHNTKYSIPRSVVRLKRLFVCLTGGFLRSANCRSLYPLFYQRGNWKKIYYDRSRDWLINYRLVCKLSNKRQFIRTIKKSKVKQWKMNYFIGKNFYSRFTLLPYNFKKKKLFTQFNIPVLLKTNKLLYNMSASAKLKKLSKFTHRYIARQRYYRRSLNVFNRRVFQHRFFVTKKLEQNFELLAQNKRLVRYGKAIFFNNLAYTKKANDLRFISNWFKVLQHVRTSGFYYYSAKRQIVRYSTKLARLKHVEWFLVYNNKYKRRRLLAIRRYLRLTFKHHLKYRYIRRKNLWDKQNWSSMVLKWRKKKFYFMSRKFIPAQGWFRWKLSFSNRNITKLFTLPRRFLTSIPWLNFVFFSNKLYTLRNFFEYRRAVSLLRAKRNKHHLIFRKIVGIFPRKIHFSTKLYIEFKRNYFFYFSIYNKYVFNLARRSFSKSTYKFVSRDKLLYNYFVSFIPSIVYQLSLAPTITWALNYISTGFIFCNKSTKVV